ncbi:MAG TPA: zinc ribbon domain-containing protein [Pyrinomonadaceae bacterium]|jgi:hypothetical protein
MRTRKLTRAVFAALLLLLATLPRESPAQQPTPAHTHNAASKAADIGSFVKEIMALEIEGETQHTAVWFPFEFFVAAGMADGKEMRAAVERNMSLLKPYLIIAVQVNRDLPGGTTLYQTESEVRSRSAIKLDDGTEIAPLTKVPPMVTAALVQMKSIFSQRGGESQANTFFMLFPNKTGTGKLVVDERQRDKLTLLLKASRNFPQTTFTWRTPFDAVTGVPDCPKCKAGLSAKWTYCPYCGQKISH